MLLVSFNAYVTAYSMHTSLFNFEGSSDNVVKSSWLVILGKLFKTAHALLIL